MLPKPYTEVHTLLNFSVSTTNSEFDHGKSMI